MKFGPETDSDGAGDPLAEAGDEFKPEEDLDEATIGGLRNSGLQKTERSKTIGIVDFLCLFLDYTMRGMVIII